MNICIQYKRTTEHVICIPTTICIPRYVFPPRLLKVRVLNITTLDSLQGLVSGPTTPPYYRCSLSSVSLVVERSAVVEEHIASPMRPLVRQKVVNGLPAAAGVHNAQAVYIRFHTREADLDSNE